MGHYHRITINPQKITSLDTNPFAQLSLAEKWIQCIVDILNNFSDGDYDAQVISTEVGGHEFQNSLKFKGELSENHLAFLKAFCPYIHVSSLMNQHYRFELRGDMAQQFNEQQEHDEEEHYDCYDPTDGYSYEE